jgi:hypothetical protein
MNVAALVRLQRLLGMVRTAEELRLAGVTTKIAACRARAGELRREIECQCIDPQSPGGALVAADMVARSRWSTSLAARADAEEARAVAMEAEAAALRVCLARAFGRQSAAVAMLEKAQVDERKLTVRRAEESIITPKIQAEKTLDQ